MRLTNKNIVLCVTGCIAAYKAVTLASTLKKEGANVYVILSKNAARFITPLTFKTITRNKVTVELFDESDFVPHISLANLADMVVVAPATANIIAKAAHGIADDMISTLLLSTQAPKIIVPAMNTSMYLNPITKENIEKLKKYNYRVIQPDDGLLACGTKGPGRFPEIDKIMGFIYRNCNTEKNIYRNKRILVTAGGTVEDIDPVRCITNRSSGKMGFAFAEEFLLRGAKVNLLIGKVSDSVLAGFMKRYPDVEILKIRSANDLKLTMTSMVNDFDLLFMAAAVADYTCEYSEQKIKKKSDQLTLKLQKTTDIVGTLPKKSDALYIGFAAESENLLKNAKNKLIAKNLDIILANEITGENQAIGSDNAEIWLLNKWNNHIENFHYQNKSSLASLILDKIDILIQENHPGFLK